MSIALIALKLTKRIPEIEADYIGADLGALILAKQGKHMRLALGDFDSVAPEDLDLIRQMSDEMIVLNPVKDDSDSESALNHVLAMGYDHVVMCGALGGRIDHEIVNLRLVYKSPGRISIMDDQNRITAYGVGRHVIKAEGYSYISFFTESEAIISLENMKYPLRDRRITYRDLYTVSNEILSEEGILEVSSGSVLVIQSKDQ